MFSIGFMEIALTLVIMLLVLGPKRLPTVAKQLGQWFGMLQQLIQQLKQTAQTPIDQDKDENE